jgi:NTP pyrophosphatase (non-canonical NTP hydrolase)
VEAAVSGERTISEWVEAVAAFAKAKGFWSDGDRPAELAMLVVTEVAEYVEALRDGHGPGEWYLTDAGKPDGPAAELGDVVIRCFDMAARYGIDLDAVLAAKHAYNEGRAFQHGGRVLNREELA